MHIDMNGERHGRSPTVAKKKKAPAVRPGLSKNYFGGVLLSHTLPSAVPSAQLGLASGFGMEPGVSPTL